MLKLTLLTLSTLACSSAVHLHTPQKPTAQLIRIQSNGGTTFDSDILLPYSIIQHIQHEEQQQHWLKYKSKVRALTTNHRRILVAPYPPLRKPYYRRSRTFLKAVSAAASASATSSSSSSISSARNQVSGNGKIHFERDHLEEKNFKLYDDDGEHLLNLGDLLKTPLITNVTSSWHRGDDTKSPRLIKHIWVNL